MVTALDKQTALVLIDLQNGIVKSKTVTPIEDVIIQVIKLVDAFRKKGLPIVLVNVKPNDTSHLRKDAKSNFNIASLPPEFSELIPDIKKEQTDIYITKQTWNAFYETALDEELKKRGVTGIVLGGVSTSIGVEGTARAAFERGYNIAFAKDAMTDTVAETQERSLQYIFPRIGEVDNTDKIIELLS